ncbi:MAG: ATP-binding protein [Planctomycetes bacterium]|nr:ATP-binding protein [Planctomycetota bacterium]
MRYGLALCLGAAVILLAAGAWNMSLQRDHLTDMVHLSGDRIADTILRSTRDAMMDNDPEDLQRIIRAIGAQPGIERIRIFDKSGRIGTSTKAEEVASMVDKSAEQCYVCHAADRPLERLERPDRLRVFERNGGARVMAIIQPIRNEPDCSTAACHAHPPGQQVLGVLDVQLSLAQIDKQLASSERQLAFGLLATTAALLVLAGALTWRMVLRPVRSITDASRKVGAGDLSVRAPVTSSDEIGEMTESWNRMVDEISRGRREREEWNRTLERRVDEKTRELERTHEQMMLVEKMASLGKLAAVVAHEINNPLAGIQTYAKLLRRRAGSGSPPWDGEATRALELVEGEAARCGEIVRNLLLFSRTPGARFAQEALAPLIGRCVLLLRHKAELLGIEIKVGVAADLPPVTCDASQVQQVVLALAMNAIEAMTRGGVLTIRATGHGDHVALEVRDTGTGIPKEHLPHIFEPFFTTKEEGKGVGLGLAVVYGIVQRHGGRVRVASTPGEGTTFTVELPLEPPRQGNGRPQGESHDAR